jgi:prephenate dehydrogenase
MSNIDTRSRFGTVAIVGVGLIGGSLGMALKERRLAATVIGVGRSAERLQHAKCLGAVDRTTTDLIDGVTHADLVVLSTTIGHILDHLGPILSAVSPATIVTDVGSTKSAIVKKAGRAPNFVGGHPMAGSERVSVEAARPNLFENATWAFTPTDATSDTDLARVRGMAQAIGARALVLSPAEHDRCVAVTSHLPHAIASSFMRHAAMSAESAPEMRMMTAGSFADMTRIAAASPDIWRDVCVTNRDAVLAAIGQFESQLEILKKAVEAGDPAAIEAFFAQGFEAKRNWSAS